MIYPSMSASRKRLINAIAAAVVALAAAAAGAQDASKAAGQGMSKGGEPMMGQGSSNAMHMSMMKRMKEMESMRGTGDVDRDFATMMRMHHQQGIDMAQEELRRGKDPQMKAMAKRIADDQAKEVKEFDDWLAKQKR
jgi:uncharacterized protein (DUF305 family)